MVHGPRTERVCGRSGFAGETLNPSGVVRALPCGSGFAVPVERTERKVLGGVRCPVEVRAKSVDLNAESVAFSGLNQFFEI